MSSSSDSDEEFHSGAELEISDIEEDELNELLERCSQDNKDQKNQQPVETVKSNVSEEVRKIDVGKKPNQSEESDKVCKDDVSNKIAQSDTAVIVNNEVEAKKNQPQTTNPADSNLSTNATSVNKQEAKVDDKLLNKQLDSLKLNSQKTKESEELCKSEESKGPSIENIADDGEWGDGWDVEDVDQVISDSSKQASVKLETKHDNEPQKSGWPSWNSWGGGVFDLGTNLLSTATEGVTGITTMLQNTIKAPDPAELAQQISGEKEETGSDTTSALPIDPARVTGLVNNLFDGVSTLGTKVISGGLDTLETIGKKTIDAIPLGDPELRKTANLFQGEKINLSQVLREARERTDAAESPESAQESKSRLAQYETIFDDSNGSLYLEALQMTSDESKVKLNCLRSDTNLCTVDDYNQAIKQVSDLYDNNPYDSSEDDVISTLNINETLNSIKESLKLNVNPSNLIEVYSRISSRIEDTSSLPTDASEIHCCAITDMAHFTAHSLAIIHRMAELILIQKDFDVDILFEGVSRFVATVKSIINKISEFYAQKLNLIDDKKSNAMINNLFLEDTNSSTHLDKAFELFSPIFQFKVLSQSLDVDR